MIKDMGEMLYNHACLGMWSTFKEPEIYCFTDKPNNYFRLCEVLKESLGTIDPTVDPQRGLPKGFRTS